jgi:hypothetical protein
MFKFTCKFRFLCAAAILLAPVLHAEHALVSPEFARGSGIEMRVTNFYESIPPAGFLPLRVEVKNGSSAPHTWQLDTVQTKYGLGSMRGIFSLKVEAGSERTFDLLVPLMPESNTSSRYSNLSIVASGYAVVNGTSSEHSSGGGKPPTPFLGMGKVLAVKNWGPLRDLLDKKGSLSLDGTPLNTDLLPADWRGLAGFGIIVFTSEEWRKIPVAQRTALQDWVAQGGRLVLSVPETPAPADLPAAASSGFGRVEHWPAGDDLLEHLSTALATLQTPASEEALQKYTRDWPMAREVGRPEPPRAFIVIFVVLFAAIIGPVNFLVFAPAGNRHRLFWTTPLISLIASLLMGIFIVSSEGFGGSGQRFQVLLNLPEFHKNVVWQEQVSRTGVLSSSAFVPSEPVVALPVTLRNNSDSTGPMQGMGKTYSLDGETWSGDWFRSRSTQAQLFTAVAPTRARLEVTNGPDGNPVAVSSFEQELDDLWYFDETGNPWHAGKVHPGEKCSMKAAEKSDFTKWWNTALEPAGTVTKARATAFHLGDLRGKFFASTAHPELVSSLSSIRWKQGCGLVLGRPAL